MNMSLWQIISTTDIISKFVLCTLVGMSVICWALAIFKRKDIALKIKALQQAQGLLQNTKGMDDLLARTSVMQANFPGTLITGFLTDFKKMLRVYESGVTRAMGTGSALISDKDWYLLQTSINQRIDETLSEEERLIPWLSTAAQAAPLIGLFGTVWGLIHAFMGIAEKQSADIAAVAPGIAEALITTMGGLVVAIPALILFNYLIAQMKKLEKEVVQVSDTCIWIMRTIVSQYESNQPQAPGAKTAQMEL